MNRSLVVLKTWATSSPSSCGLELDLVVVVLHDRSGGPRRGSGCSRSSRSSSSLRPMSFRAETQTIGTSLPCGDRAVGGVAEVGGR